MICLRRGGEQWGRGRGGARDDFGYCHDMSVRHGRELQGAFDDKI